MSSTQKASHRGQRSASSRRSALVISLLATARRHGWPKIRLARKLKVHPNSVFNWQSGTRPSERANRRIAKLLASVANP